MSKLVDRAQELGTIVGVDAIFDHDDDRPLVVLDHAPSSWNRTTNGPSNALDI
jgi:hypothetical protein